MTAPHDPSDRRSPSPDVAASHATEREPDESGTGETDKPVDQVGEASDVRGSGAEQDATADPDNGPDPLRFNRWMKRSTTGAVLTGVTIGLQQALEKRDQRPPFVIEAPGEPEDDAPLVRLQFDPDNPSNTVAVVRADAGHDSPHPPDVDIKEHDDGAGAR